VSASLSLGEGWCSAEINLDELQRLRQRMPVSEHRRRALIG
jgi:predicted amidohydrolase